MCAENGEYPRFGWVDILRFQQHLQYSRCSKSIFVIPLKLVSMRLTLFKYFLVCQEIQQSNSQHSKFVLLAMNVITNNDNLTKVVID